MSLRQSDTKNRRTCSAINPRYLPTTYVLLPQTTRSENLCKLPSYQIVDIRKPREETPTIEPKKMLRNATGYVLLMEMKSNKNQDLCFVQCLQQGKLPFESRSTISYVWLVQPLDFSNACPTMLDRYDQEE